MGFTLHPLVTVLIALTPAALALWWGRGISRHLDDPLLPERLFANRRRTGPVFGMAFGLLVVGATGQLVWALPLLVLARMTAAYPLRKTLHAETWSLAAYLSFYLRLLVAAFGFWILLSATPFLTMLAGTRDWMIGGLLAAIAIAWTRNSSTIFRWILRTRPVDDAELVSRFEKMRAECGLPHVSLEQVDLKGGALINGVAVPSIDRPAVVVTDTLISRMSRDETMGILAHELAHLEFYNPQRLQRNNTVTYGLIAFGAFMYPILRVTVPQALGAAGLLWPLVLFAAALLRAQHRQKHETESDLRSVQLTGDPEALVRALCKLHTFARVPRRWDTEFERHATHPSLARRIQAIRGIVGAAPAVISEAVTFAAPIGKASVTFHDDRLDWSDGASTDALDYRDLTELRIRSAASGVARLVAVDSKSRTRELVLQPADTTRAQSVLDIVDGRLGKASAPPVVPLRIARVLSLLAIAAGMAVAQFSVLVAGLLALIRPAPQLAAATGASAITAAVLTWLHPSWAGEDALSWQALTLFFSGVVLIGTAFANRSDPSPALVKKLVALLAVFAMIACVMVLMFGLDAVDLHRSALEWPAAGIMTLGLSGALALSSSPRRRWGAVPVALVGVLAVFLGSTAFVEAFVNDPFLEPSASVTMSTVSGPPLTEFSVDVDATGLWVSPAGRNVALQSWNDDTGAAIHAGPARGPLADFDADDAVFLDDNRLMLVKGRSRVTTLRVINLSDHGAGGGVAWSRQVALSSAEASVDRASGRWRLIGWDSTGHIASVDGSVGDETDSQMRWDETANDIESEGDDDTYVEAMSVSHAHALVLERRPVLQLPGRLERWLLFLLIDPRDETRLRVLHHGSRTDLASSRVEVHCGRSVHIDQSVTCAAFDGDRTRFFGVDAETRRITAQASVAGRVYLHDTIDRDWVVGWWNRELVAFRPTRRDAVRVPPADGWPHQLAVGDTVLASLTSRGAQSTIRLYPMPAR